MGDYSCASQDNPQNLSEVDCNFTGPLSRQMSVVCDGCGQCQLLDVRSKPIIFFHFISFYPFLSVSHFPPLNKDEDHPLNEGPKASSDLTGLEMKGKLKLVGREVTRSVGEMKRNCGCIQVVCCQRNEKK